VSEGQKFKYLETRNSDRDALENTHGVMHLHRGSNNNPSARQFLGALKTVIVNGLASRSKDGGTCLLDKLHSFHDPSSASSTSQSLDKSWQ
jgi:hypothetical protein